MARPTLTTQEIAQLNTEKARATSAAATFTAQIAAQQARASELALADSGFQKFFQYYNDSIIGFYDAERKSLSGNFIASPITESDIIGCASLTGNRIQPSLPATNVVRIAQFDGTPLASTQTNEGQHIADQLTTETTLVSGYPGFVQSATLTSTSAVTSSSTTMTVKDTATVLALATNQVFILANGSDLAVVKVMSVTLDPGGPPYTATLGIQLLVPPTGTIPTNLLLKAFSGFNNSERTSKTASDSTLQPLMNQLILDLQTFANDRIARLVEQVSAINSNQDPDGIIQLATAKTNAQTSSSFLTSYLISTIISDTGLASLATERSTRGSQITTRIAQILANYTGQTENYYNRRYEMANNRANTARGTLRLQKAAEANAMTSQSYAQTLQDQADAIDELLG